MHDDGTAVAVAVNAAVSISVVDVYDVLVRLSHFGVLVAVVVVVAEVVGASAVVAAVVVASAVVAIAAAAVAVVAVVAVAAVDFGVAVEQAMLWWEWNQLMAIISIPRCRYCYHRA